MTHTQLISWRHALHFSKSQAAHALNVPLDTYLNWETEKRGVPRPVARLAQYIQAFGVLEG